MAGHRQTLYDVARTAIEQGFILGEPLTIDLSAYAPILQAHRASFVTLQIDHTLRGCIGTVEAYRPLVIDVAHHAYVAAFSDARFPPLQQEELAMLTMHISVLSAPEPLTFSSESELIQQLRPNIDGLILGIGKQRATFLPSVWTSLTDPSDFLKQLKRKAGLAPDYWSDQIKVYRYTIED